MCLQILGHLGGTLAHNARSKDEVMAILSRVEAHGGRIAKAAADTFWGGFGGYFADPDDHYLEVVYGAMFEFDAQGGLFPRLTHSDVVQWHVLR